MGQPPIPMHILGGQPTYLILLLPLCACRLLPMGQPPIPMHLLGAQPAYIILAGLVLQHCSEPFLHELQPQRDRRKHK